MTPTSIPSAGRHGARNGGGVSSQGPAVNKLRVMVACEYSGRVRDSFITKGHDATSLDVLPTDAPGPHVVADVVVIGILDADRRKKCA